MPSRISAWGIYDVFEGKGGEQIFLGVVSDTQWRIFCDVFGLQDLANDPRVASNNQRVLARAWLIPRLQEIFRKYSVRELQDLFEANALPYAPIVKPEQLFDDPHLTGSGGPAPPVPATRGEAQRPRLPPPAHRRRRAPRPPPPGPARPTRAARGGLGHA